MRKGFFFLFLLTFFASAAAADLTLSYFKIDGYTAHNIEAGSRPNVTLQYENKTGSAVVISDIEIYLYYDADVISRITDIQNKTHLQAGESDYYSTPGKITYKLTSAVKGLSVKAGGLVDIATINFQVKDILKQTGPGIALFSWLPFSSTRLSPIEPTKTEKLTRSKVTDVGYRDVTGSLTSLRTVRLTPRSEPIFSGVGKVYCADIQNVPNTGNSLWVLWNPATDDWPPVRYSVYRKSEKDANWIAIGETTENFHFDENLTDNTYYEYKVYATDAGGNVNQSQVAIGDKPHDYKAPGDVKDLAASFQDGAIKLSWQPPDNQDFTGVMIVRDPQGFWIPEGASGDSNGKAYEVGSEPWGEENGVVVYVDEYGGTSFEDYNIELGKTYSYKVFAMDETWSGQGRNYSNGKTISIQAGEGARGVLAAADWVIPYDFKEGINYFSLPYIGVVLDSDENIVENLGQLGDEINRQAGENTVLSIGYWDSEAQEAKGIRFDYTSADKYVPIKGITAAEAVIPGGAYVVSVSKSFQFTINLSFAQYE